jgi:hypothetical protein
MESMVGIDPIPEAQQKLGWGGTNNYPTYAEHYKWTATGNLTAMLAGNPMALEALRPRFMQIPPVSSGVVEFLNSLKRMIIDILGSGMANMGPMPQNVSGTSLEVQSNIDNTGYIALIKSWQSFKKKFWFDVMCAVPLVYDKIDVAKILHQPVDKIDAIFTNSITDSFDIKYADTSALPSSPIKRIEALTNLMAVVPPSMQGQIVKLISDVSGNMGLNIGVPNIEEELAEKENEFILNDESLMALYLSKKPEDKQKAAQVLMSLVTPLQNDDTHDGTHRKPVIGAQAMNYAPGRLDMITLHIQAHEASKQSKQIGAQPDQTQGDSSGIQNTVLAPGSQVQAQPPTVQGMPPQL